jgi:hypothetical protein
MLKRLIESILAFLFPPRLPTRIPGWQGHAKLSPRELTGIEKHFAEQDSARLIAEEETNPVRDISDFTRLLSARESRHPRI